MPPEDEHKLPEGMPPEVEKYPSLVLLIREGKAGEVKALLDILQRGSEHLVLPVRRFRVDENNQIITHTGENNPGEKPKIRIVGRVTPGETLEETGNTLDRELVLRIAGLKDIWLQEDFSLIMRFRDMVLRCAGSRKVREALWRIRANYPTLIKNIQKNQLVPNIERDAKNFYTLCLKELKISEVEKKLIEHFSWKWKSSFAPYPNACNSWIIIVCIMELIDFSN